MNKVLLIGRLTKDPELRYAANTGTAIGNFTLAVDRPYTNAEGKRETDFIPIVCWRKLAESVANNLTKGKLVAISGSIQTRKYQAQDGTNRYITEVVADEVKFLDRPKTDANPTENQQETDEFMPVFDDENIPF